MLAYKNRFHGHGSLRFVYKNGHASRSHVATIKVTNNSRRSNSRIAVVVSKKVIKSAVGRNRIRRRVYEIFRTELPHFANVYDIACIVSSSEARVMSDEELRDTIIKSLKELKVIY